MAGAAGRVLKEGVAGVASMTGSVLPSMGGAVDIVVVRQEDGSFRSSPFYGALSWPEFHTNSPTIQQGWAAVP